MVLTTEGALLALILAVLVCGAIGAWALLCLAARRLRGGGARRRIAEPGNVRRVIVPAGHAPKV